eukprot:3929464-Prymnesium_polylepis.1
MEEICEATPSSSQQAEGGDDGASALPDCVNEMIFLPWISSSRRFRRARLPAMPTSAVDESAVVARVQDLMFDAGLRQLDMLAEPSPFRRPLRDRRARKEKAAARGGRSEEARTDEETASSAALSDRALIAPEAPQNLKVVAVPPRVDKPEC